MVGKFLDVGKESCHYLNAIATSLHYCLGIATFCDNGEIFQIDISLADFKMNGRVRKV